jgi:Putative prokaryotic signal transducing protein
VKPRDPEEERRRLAELYASMTEGELRKIAEDPKALTDAAIESLNKEFARRNLDVELEISKPELEQSHQEIPELVILRHFRDLPEALLAKGGLESAGIECFFDDDNIVRMDWFISNAVGGIKLLVRPEDFAAANEILEQGVPTAFDVPGLGEYQQPCCPKCGSLDVVSEVVKKVAAGAATNSGGEVPALQRGWKCQSCGHAWAEAAGNIGDAE